MKIGLALGALCLVLGCGAAAAQGQGYGGRSAQGTENQAAPQQDEDSYESYGQESQGSQQGTSPREAWRQYMMKRRGMTGQDGQEGGGWRGGHHGRDRMGMMGQGARFMFDRDRGRIIIQCAPSDSTDACAKAILPLIEQVMGASAAKPPATGERPSQ